MIRIESDYLTTEDREVLRRFCVWTLDQFLSQQRQKETTVIIKILAQSDLPVDSYYNFKNHDGWCHHKKSEEGRNCFEIVIKKTFINQNAKAIHRRLKKVFITVGHELVHVKQYTLREMVDLKTGEVKFRGVKFPENTRSEDILYYNAPWEIEAHGRELGLYSMFAKIIKAEQKAKKKEANVKKEKVRISREPR